MARPLLITTDFILLITLDFSLINLYSLDSTTYKTIKLHFKEDCILYNVIRKYTKPQFNIISNNILTAQVKPVNKEPNQNWAIIDKRIEKTKTLKDGPNIASYFRMFTFPNWAILDGLQKGPS